MRIFLDTNVLMDLVNRRRPHAIDSFKLYEICESNLLPAYASILSAANMQYITRKDLSHTEFNEIYSTICRTIVFVDLTKSDFDASIALNFSDPEDALQAIAAESLDCSYIITHNVKDFKNSPVPALTPRDFLTKVVIGIK